MLSLRKSTLSIIGVYCLTAITGCMGGSSSNNSNSNLNNGNYANQPSTNCSPNQHVATNGNVADHNSNLSLMAIVTNQAFHANNLALLNAPVTDSCLKGVFSISGGDWSTQAQLILTNTCSSSINLDNVTVSWDSENSAGSAITQLQSFATAGSNFKLNIDNVTGDKISTTIKKSSWGSDGLVAGGSIAFNGGFNSLGGSCYDVNLANSSITINGAKPPVQQFGTLDIVFNASGICSSGDTCSADSVNLINSSKQTVKSFSFNAWNKTTKVEIDNLLVDTYTVAITDNNGYSVSEDPALINVVANTTVSTNVSFSKAAKMSDIIVKLPTKQSLGLTNLPDSIPVKLYNSDSKLINTYQVSLNNETTDIGKEPSGSYRLEFPNLGDAKLGKIYSGGVASFSIGNDGNPQTVLFNYQLATATINFTFNLSGLKNSDTANFAFTDSLATIYALDSGIANGALILTLPKGIKLYPTATASNYTSNLSPGQSFDTSKISSASVVFTPSSTPSSGLVKGWPKYLAMGSLSSGLSTEPTNVRIDSVFTYYGSSGGSSDWSNVQQKQIAVQAPSKLKNLIDFANKVDSNPNITQVLYTSNLSGGNIQEAKLELKDPVEVTKHLFNVAFAAHLIEKDIQSHQGATGSILLNPDWLGTYGQQNLKKQWLTNFSIATNEAVANVYYVMNHSIPTSVPFVCKVYQLGFITKVNVSGSVDDIYNEMPSGDQWDKGTEFADCMNEVIDAEYNPNQVMPAPLNGVKFSDDLSGWVQAHHWLIYNFGDNNVSYGWGEAVWAAGSGFWVHDNADEAKSYANSVTNDITSLGMFNSGFKGCGGNYCRPDFIYFDRYGYDDNQEISQATLYTATSWHRYLEAVKLVSEGVGATSKQNPVPIMLWQIPSAHIPTKDEALPPKPQSRAEEDSAPVFFFGDSNLAGDLSNVDSSIASQIIPYAYTDCGGLSVPQCLVKDHFNWAHQDNEELQEAVNSHVFSILWGAAGANVTSPWPTDGALSDNGWMIKALAKYYTNTQPFN